MNAASFETPAAMTGLRSLLPATADGLVGGPALARLPVPGLGRFRTERR